jgi:hypothetical protein
MLVRDAHLFSCFFAELKRRQLRLGADLAENGAQFVEIDRLGKMIVRVWRERSRRSHFTGTIHRESIDRSNEDEQGARPDSPKRQFLVSTWSLIESISLTRLAA